MTIRLRNLGDVAFDSYTIISSDEILVISGNVYEKLQTQANCKITSICLFTNEGRWYLFADLNLPDDLIGILNDEFVTRIEDAESVYRLNALLYDA